MANKIILADTSILIDFFRKTDKSNSVLLGLVKKGYSFKISAITEFEIYSGTNKDQLTFWNELLEKIEVLAFDKDVVKVAVELNNALKRKRKQIDMADLFIAATAVSNKLPIATLNKKHFERIDTLKIIP
ncbi:MAG: type II toxin-antitoxin system VapC family toxin [Sphingobacteriales bacterium]|nr:type II toxin-antitoxin system VapC family toxin [Sphingobacteriales bacterium]